MIHWASASSKYSKMEHTASATTAQYFKAAAIAVASAAEKYFQLLTVQSPDTKVNTRRTNLFAARRAYVRNNIRRCEKIHESA